ncbi:hypothetical protein BDW75DRAFT_231464 [Aspergillus navahoensis]
MADHSKATIRVTSLAYVHYSHPDLEKVISFLQDFGLVLDATVSGKCYFRGYGEHPCVYVAEQSTDGQRHFLGGYWMAESSDDLKKAALHPNAVSGIEASSAPGGGQVVRLRDPFGFIVGFVHGQKLREAGCLEPLSVRSLEENEVPANDVRLKNRKGVFRRFRHGPAPVHKLGHYGIMVSKNQLDAAMRWYYGTMNLTPTDYVVDPETQAVETVFNHINLGKRYTDHHSFFISAPGAAKPHVHHSSFEVNDFDTQVLGHHWLQAKGYVNCWGIGRHVLGSQIFDYW